MAVLGVRVVRMLDYAEGELDRVGLRPARRADRRADPDASAGGDPQLRPRRDHRRHRPHRPLARRARGLSARRGAAGVRETTSRRTRSPGAPPSSTTSSCPVGRAPSSGSRAPAEGYGSDDGADAGARARRARAAQAGGDQPPRVADGLRRPVPRLGSRGPRRVPGDRALPARRQHRRRPGGAAASGEQGFFDGLGLRRSSRARLCYAQWAASAPHGGAPEPAHGQSADRREHPRRPRRGEGPRDRARSRVARDGEADHDRRQRRRPDRRAHHARVPAQGDDRERHRRCADAAGREPRARRLGEQREAQRSAGPPPT